MSNEIHEELQSVANAEQDADGTFELPLLMLEEQVLFPQVLSLVPLPTAPMLELVAAAKARHSTIIACKLRAEAEDKDPLQQIHAVGTEIAPGKLSASNGASPQLLAHGRRRVRILSVYHNGVYPVAVARPLADTFDEPQTLEHLATALHNLFNESHQYNEGASENAVKHILSLRDPARLADSLAAMLPLGADELQNLLELEDIASRMERLAELIAADLSNFELHDDLHSRVQDEIAAHQREMYLREQMRLIQQELGDGDMFQQEMQQFREKIQQAGMPAEARDKALKELSRLGAVPPMSPESGVIHTYLDRLLTLPWNTASEENLDLRHAEDILERAHYGLSKVKARIIEHIAVRQLARDKMKSPILCFVGPPGVGKTSLGKSIADALGCKFLRISLGGVRDEAEIRGHRRTYIGSMPGRIVQQMERAETVNPVFMLDEIDKMSVDFRGDPASALLEVLDPEQNHSFVDHYLEVPYDLSKVTFITTANDLYSIPEALEDRLEVIEFKGYSEEEKIQIARRFLIPKQLAANGLEQAGIHFSTAALQQLIRHYTYESGVRNLEREIAKVCRKIARQVAAERHYRRRLNPAIVESYLGPPQTLAPRVNRRDAIGVVSGLVWTPNGGEIQTVEVSLSPGKGSLMLTGQLGDVLQESAHIAHSYLRARARDFALPADDFENYDVHIHMPEGAVPKDGPSAGVTLATALVSAFTERPASAAFAMTGELTLRGQVLPVGGVVEKILAARRRNVPAIILPADNQKDLRELPKAARRDVTIRFVEDIQEIFDLVLLTPPDKRKREQEAEDKARDAEEDAS